MMSSILPQATTQAEALTSAPLPALLYFSTVIVLNVTREDLSGRVEHCAKTFDSPLAPQLNTLLAPGSLASALGNPSHNASRFPMLVDLEYDGRCYNATLSPVAWPGSNHHTIWSCPGQDEPIQRYSDLLACMAAKDVLDHRVSVDRLLYAGSVDTNLAKDVRAAVVRLDALTTMTMTDSSVMPDIAPVVVVTNTSAVSPVVVLATTFRDLTEFQLRFSQAVANLSTGGATHAYDSTRASSATPVDVAIETSGSDLQPLNASYSAFVEEYLDVATRVCQALKDSSLQGMAQDEIATLEEAQVDLHRLNLHLQPLMAPQVTDVSTCISRLQESAVDDSDEYCSGSWWENMHASYKILHGPLCLVVCVVGILANIINIAVFTRRSMATPTNALLMALAVSDLLLLLAFLPSSFMATAWPKNNPTRTTWGGAAYLVGAIFAAPVLNASSLMLSVVVGLWRFGTIAMPKRTSGWFTMHNTRIAIGSVYTIAILGHISHFLKRVVRRKGDIYYPGYSDLAMAHDEFLKKFDGWFTEIFLRLLPLLLCSILTLLLIRELIVARHRQAGQQTPKKSRAIERTTLMLALVLIIQLVSVGPHAVLIILRHAYSDTFGLCDRRMAKITYLMLYINASVNLIVYVTVSKTFRQQLKRMVCGMLPGHHRDEEENSHTVTPVSWEMKEIDHDRNAHTSTHI